MEQISRNKFKFLCIHFFIGVLELKCNKDYLDYFIEHLHWIAGYNTVYNNKEHFNT